MLGTYVDIRVDHDDAARAAPALEAGFAAVARVQRCMSAFDPESDVGRINRLAVGDALDIDPWTADVLRLSLELHRASGGLFDCGIAPELAAWGMLPPAPSAIAGSSITRLSFAAAGTIRVSAPLRLDLGGIAKGYAVDRAADAMRACGARGGLINAGGDLRVFGPEQEAIHLRDPGNPARLRLAGWLGDGACATSATYFSRRDVGGHEVSALVDPRNRQPMRTRRSYSVFAPCCAVADALTKVVAVSQDAHHPCLERYDAHALILESCPERP